MSDTDPYTDVVELCALLQCLGFSVKSLETNDNNANKTTGARTVVINCQSSGLHVVLESVGLACSCPQNHHNSGSWHVSGVVSGKQLDKEFGYSVLGSLPKSHRDRLSRELHEMIRCIKQNNESDVIDKDIITNRSSSMMDLKTPEKINHKIKSDTPTRYRSLDTLTKVAKKENNVDMIAPKSLQRVRVNSERTIDDDNDDKKHSMCLRQGTYTLSSTPGSIRGRSKTSSPIHVSENNILDDLLAAEKTASELSKQLSKIVRGYTDENRNDSSASWLALDVSKISVFKGGEPMQTQFASSPNIPGLSATREDLTKSKLKRYESASTSNLIPDKPGTVKAGKTSYLRRISPNFLKFKKSGPGIKDPISTLQDNKSNKSIGLIKPKIVMQASPSYSKSSPNLSSSSRKKFSHVKSTIPKPTKKE